MASGLGDDGHRVICQIAYDELLPDARAELDRLLALDSTYETFAESCLFAEKPKRIRSPDHYINLPRSTQTITGASCPMAETCVIPAIFSDVAVLRSTESTDEQKLRAMKLLGHWVGDVHQPMHVAFQDDEGANKIAVDLDFRDANFHEVWDYLIIARTMGDDYAQIAAQLRQEISEEMRVAWRHASPVEWANESYQIAISPETGYCVQKQGACWYSEDNLMLGSGEELRSVEITDEYLQVHGSTVSFRLRQAGVRLAQLLNQSLTNGRK